MSLQSLATTLAIGTGVASFSLFAFGFAVRKRSVLIAPRATARPRNVIFNPHPTSSEQDRGSPTFGWIRWTLGLTYDVMLQGVPGTGTRDGGMSGSMLKVNMDGIVLLRFHAFCLRITAVATFLCLAFLLPLYYTAQCYGHQESVDFCTTSYNLTNYERTTIANVPAFGEQARAAASGILARLFVTSICFSTLIATVLYCLKEEWIQILAMRRVYYLEKDIWAERRNELKCTMLHDEVSKDKNKMKQHFNFEESKEAQHSQQLSATENRKIEKELSIGDKEDMDIRDPWIPHPEQRDTVPNIGLYSLLVGGLPNLPFDAIEHLDTEVAIDQSKRQDIDWQLSLTATFFDHCVPNQPGFSSSIAAVTIIPGAKDMTEAWRKWYKAASKLRRLRYIRRQIAQRRHYEIEIEDDDDEEEYIPDALKPGQESKYEGDNTQTGVSQFPSMMNADLSDTLSPRPIYKDLEKRKSYFRKVLGSNGMSELDTFTYEIEQASVYSREFAQAAAPCCPNGCREHRIQQATIDELLDMEREAVEEVHVANLELNELRRKITFATNNLALASSIEESIAEGLTASKVAKANLDLEANLYEKSKSDKKLKHAALKRSRSDDPAASDPNTLTYDASAVTSSLPKRPEKLSSSSYSRDSTLQLHRDLTSPDWKTVQSIVNSSAGGYHASMASKHPQSSGRDRASKEISNGMWQVPTFSVGHSAFKALMALKEWVTQKSVDAVESVARETSYAIVTFTSRQAAVAARNCLADGRGSERWLTIQHIPTPPLADAPPCDIASCRNCCRPVTISISNRQKNFRRIAAFIMLFIIYVFYTFPITAISALATPQNLNAIFPGIEDYLGRLGMNLSGLVAGLLYSLFFSLCPMMFKAISNFGSGAVSASQAEFRALQYFWWFMVVTGFSANLLGSMTINAINNDLMFGSELRTVIVQIANTVPTTIASTWLNWIIVRFTFVLPLNYLLTINTFVFSFLGLPCCVRAVTGGGPGGPTPYRVFVDSGMVLLCTLSLAPSSPIVAPFAVFYFLVCTPIFRRSLIFMYRPKFDGGGARWPFVSDMIISCIMMGIVLTVSVLALKAAIIPAIIAALPAIPTLMFGSYIDTRLKPAYRDAGLLQTSLLDGWDIMDGEPSSAEQREEFRRFLVDAHKAAYVPVCITGPDIEGFITAEPAVVMPLDTDEDMKVHEDVPAPAKSEVFREVKPQHGATLRRACISAINVARMRKSDLDPGIPTIKEVESASNAGSSVKAD